MSKVLAYVLVDYENVQPLSVDSLIGQRIGLRFFLGPYSKIKLDLGMSIDDFKAFGGDFEMITNAKPGKNALDFFITFYAGSLSATTKSGVFIVSKDTGFDPLISHLCANHVQAKRVVTIDGIWSHPLLRKHRVMKHTEEVTTAIRGRDADIMAAWLNRMGAARPRSVSSLRNAIRTKFQNRVFLEADVLTLLNELKANGVIEMQGEKIIYF